MTRGNCKVHQVHGWNCAPVLYLIFSLVMLAGATSLTTRAVYFEEYSLPSLNLQGNPSVKVLGNKTPQTACAIRCFYSKPCAGFSCYRTKENFKSFLCEKCYMLSFQNLLNSTGNASVVSSTNSPVGIRTLRAFSQSVDHTASPSQAHDVHLGQGLRDGVILYIQGKATDIQFMFAIMDGEKLSQYDVWPRVDLHVHVTFDGHQRPMQIVLGAFNGTWIGPRVPFSVDSFLARGDDMEWAIFVSEDEYNIFVNGKFVSNYSRTVNGFALHQFEYVYLDPLLPRMQWLMP